jgi:uncharacterized protein (DUF1501 family)
MLDFFTGRSRDCARISRRQFLRIGGLAGFGLSLPGFLKAQEQATATVAQAPRKKATQCILLWMHGGPAQHDTFDPKPDAPSEIRGEFSTIPTRLPGVQFVEHLPKLARNLDKFSVIRGHHPNNDNHDLADHWMMSGHRIAPGLAYPCYGSVVAKERGYPDGIFPFVQLGNAVNRQFHGGTAGFLGDQYNPFDVHDNPTHPDFAVRDLSVRNEHERVRLERRFGMLAELERYQRRVESTPGELARDEFYQKAHALVTSPKAKRAFDLNLEPTKLRDAYGRTPLGQYCLLARRLVEAGVHFVTVSEPNWDTHNDNFNSLKKHRLPALDAAYGTLLEDLADRGLLDTTLVVWFGDFGRTPKINPAAGRDHWAHAGVACMGGGGVKCGQVVGATNALGEYVVDDPVTTQDIAATIYHAMGVPLDTWYRAPDGRPIELLPEGKPVRQLVG